MLTTIIDMNISATLTKAKDLGNTPSSPLEFVNRVSLSTGTGAGQADKLFYDERSVAASSSEDLDIVGALTDDYGDSFNPVRIKAIGIKAGPYSSSGTANTNNVVVGGASATQWAALLGTTGTITLRPGSCFIMAAGTADATGYVCAAGATDLLKVANSGAGSAVLYQIVLIGASA